MIKITEKEVVDSYEVVVGDPIASETFSKALKSILRKVKIDLSVMTDKIERTTKALEEDYLIPSEGAVSDAAFYNIVYGLGIKRMTNEENEVLRFFVDGLAFGWFWYGFKP